MALPTKRPHAIRIEDDLWKASLAKATEDQTDVSHEIREFLKRWTSGAEPASVSR